jgi:hypothetical protein
MIYRCTNADCKSTLSTDADIIDPSCVACLSPLEPWKKSQEPQSSKPLISKPSTPPSDQTSEESVGATSYRHLKKSSSILISQDPRSLRSHRDALKTSLESSIESSQGSTKRPIELACPDFPPPPPQYRQSSSMASPHKDPFSNSLDDRLERLEKMARFCYAVCKTMVECDFDQYRARQRWNANDQKWKYRQHN